MASVISLQTRLIMIASLIMVSLFWSDARAQDAAPLPDYVIEEFGEPPPIPEGPLSESLQAAVDTAFVNSVVQSAWGRDQALAMEEVVASKDPRIAWIIADLMRFVSAPSIHADLAETAGALLGKEFEGSHSWGAVTDHLIAWDVPAPPNYLQAKRTIFTSIVPGWDRIFVEGDVDWRLVSWGGVLIDNRQIGRAHV